MRASVVALLLAGCAANLEGTWIGDVECNTEVFDYELDLSKSGKKEFSGTGEQYREFTNLEGLTTTDEIKFDVVLGLKESKGAQDLDTEMSCTSELRVQYRPGETEADVVRDGCTPLRFSGYVISWDGEDTLEIGGPDECQGAVTRR